MKPDWKTMSRDERTTAIIGVWFEGATSTAITEALMATHEGKITRNGIIGLYHRIGYAAKQNGTHNPLGDYPLPTVMQDRSAKTTLKRMASKRQDHRRPNKVAALPRPEADGQPPALAVDLIEVKPDDAAYDATGLMLTTLQLTERTCKWSVAYTGQHLFCGHHTVTKSSYCAEHKRRSHG